MTLLGVNIDHVATLRNARGGQEPEPVTAAGIAELNGADGITVHLREDRRHINERDLRLLREVVQSKLNLEMATARDVVEIALEVRPNQITLVPERRQEITTEGGLDCVAGARKLKPVIHRFHDAGIAVSLFLDPDPAQIEKAARLGVGIVELHTGAYANADGYAQVEDELERLEVAALRAYDLGIEVFAGHGLNYRNIVPLLRRIPVEEVNIGHSIVSRAVMAGLDRAVREMKDLISGASCWTE